MDYSRSGSGAHIDDAATCLATYGGCRGIVKRDYDTGAVYSMLKEKRPVYIRARQSATGKGHAWVVDGRIYQERWVVAYDYRTQQIARSSESRGFVHCNFGWNGASDGFYTSGIFNSNRPRLNDSGKELSGKTPGLWDENIQILTYTDVRL